MRTLYGKDSKGGFKIWTVEAIGDEVHVSHGKLDGKMQLKVTKCVSKNVGRANETTPETQAQLEAESKYKKQIDKLYRPTIEELTTVGGSLPMLAHDYTKVGHRMCYPCYVSAKLDGVRAMAFVCVSGEVTMTSRGGKQYDVPTHLSEQLRELSSISGVELFDGEVYKHGRSLQNIVSAVKSLDNEERGELEFWVFDIPSEKPWKDRYEDLMKCHEHAMKLGLESIKFVLNVIVEDEGDARLVMNHYLERGFEGMMLRNPEGPYRFNHRSPDLMKWKDFFDLEAKVIEVSRDKLDEGVLECEMQDGKKFECKMRGKHVYRAYASMRTLIGAWITVRYQQFTDDGIPQFPVGIGVRECDDDGYPVV